MKIIVIVISNDHTAAYSVKFSSAEAENYKGKSAKVSAANTETYCFYFVHFSGKIHELVET